MINTIAWFCVGAMVGWLESQISSTGRPQTAVLNMVVGGVGALITSYLLSPVLGVGTIHDDNISIASLAISLFGAVIVLAVVSAVRQRSVTRHN